MGDTTWQLWEMAEVVRTIELHDTRAPLLASWDHKEHPAQIKLQAYLQALVEAVGSLDDSGNKLSLHMDIDVGKLDNLLTHHDLENYLTPVVNRLGHAHFTFVSAKKCVGGGSRLLIGGTRPLTRDLVGEGWAHFSCHAGSGTATHRWKQNIYNQLAGHATKPLLDEPVAVHLAWRCAPSNKRNWVGLWKPTGDTMGPILGQPNPKKQPFNPYDDHITELHLHRNTSETIGHTVDVGMWWRSLSISALA